ncbi:hypothetical protein POM88_005162 [Heracleum sosnowskyi]|uniref:Uncharacterized protein n=1 Tax=Heracleum sosnowskyi TaxID=360622 RepID=A0AAD8NE64_9APIA|nr:hypothetical protein POM88_005162 [Heracleum sosnowskyi]
MCSSVHFLAFELKSDTREEVEPLTVERNSITRAKRRERYSGLRIMGNGCQTDNSWQVELSEIYNSTEDDKNFQGRLWLKRLQLDYNQGIKEIVMPPDWVRTSPLGFWKWRVKGAYHVLKKLFLKRMSARDDDLSVMAHSFANFLGLVCCEGFGTTDLASMYMEQVYIETSGLWIYIRSYLYALLSTLELLIL